MIEFISQPWSWYASGILISAIMFSMLFFGQSFGFSANLRTICAISGAGRVSKFFDFNWRSQIWNLVFLVGAIIGGFIANEFLSTGEAIQISEATLRDLRSLGFSEPTSVQPSEIFSWEALITLKGFLILSVGGFLVGFGSRYAGGCTSGHAISGISDLQVPSMIAVVGFFAGGLIMTYILYPIIF
jgi:uncharacterized membrane protein YedE/YeeE